MKPSVHFDWRRLTASGAAALFPAVFALLLTLQIPATPFGEAVPLHAVTPDSASRLEAMFESIAYTWPPREQVPALGITCVPGDMADLDVGRKKELFLRALLPLVLAENARLQAERRWLEGVMSNGANAIAAARARLARMAAEYGLQAIPDEPRLLLDALYERVDEVPAGLVLAQAANESGWGTSRFSREVNNLFGEWTYRPDQGVLPERRAEGARHFVRRFDNLRSSVRSYLHNINSGLAYLPLRRLRAQLRREGRELDPLLLASGLVRYSERGEEYVAEIREMIRRDGLNLLGPLRLVRFARAG